MDTHAEFHLVLTDLESRRACGGHGAGGQREAEAADICDNLFGNGFDFGKGFALFRGGACDLVHENGTRNASSAHGIQRILDRDVVVDVYGVDLDAVVLCQSAGVVEVHAVTRIVFDYHQGAFLGSGQLQGVINLNLRGRSENVAANSRVQHARADKSRVSGFVSGTAARNQRNLVAVDDLFLNDLVFFDELQFGMRFGKAVAHIVYEALGSIHYFLH